MLKKSDILSGAGLFSAACLFIIIVILGNGLFINWRLDLTENKLFTLSKGTINILKSLEEPIQLDFYFSRKQLIAYPGLSSYGLRLKDLLQEYAIHSDGSLNLTVIEPDTFSEEEDQAVASGLQSITVNAAGDRAYFGLVGKNTTDDEMNIPFFHPNKEFSLEYDLSKLIYQLSNPKKRVVGIISSLPIFGSPTQDSWAIINILREFFEVQNLVEGLDKSLDPQSDILLLVHPKKLDDRTLYQIDQFLLRGGKAMIFLDPLSEADPERLEQTNTLAIPDLHSDLKRLLETWGLEIIPEKIATDLNAAMRVQARRENGLQEIDYLPWLRFGEHNFNADDFTTNKLNIIHMGTAGIINKINDTALTITPLIQTSRQAMQLPKDLILFQPDPMVIFNNFVSEDTRYTIVARVEGKANTAFPNGQPIDQDKEKRTIDEQLMEGDLHIILVADSDILSDVFWVRKQDEFGIKSQQVVADNGNFIVNAIDNLSGNTDLISLRSREEYARPFTRVESIRKRAEISFRKREQELREKLTETERKLQALQQKHTGENEYILSAEQSKEIRKFQEDHIKIRKELRAVRHDLQKNIELLGTKLKFINIGLIPLVIIALSLILAIYRSNK